MSNDKDFKVKNGIQPTAYHEAVGTVVSGSEPYNLAGASYDSKSFSVASQELTPRGLQFKPDGTKMYIVGNSSDQVRQYTLSTAWDISTASYDSVTLIVSGQDNTPLSLFFKPDGTKFYITGNTNLSVFQYSLSTAWDLSTASYDSVSYNFSANTSFPAGLAFKSDGFKMYITDNTNDQIDEYALSTAWDVSTASYSTNVSVSPNVTSPASFVFNAEGSAFFVCDLAAAIVAEYTLSNPWDISSSTYVRILDTSAQAASTSSLSFKTDGSKLYVVNTSDDTIYQYSTVLSTASLDLSTGSVFEITPTSDIQVTLSNPAASGTSSGATLLLDGVAATTYDIGNAVYDGVSFNVLTQDTNPQDVFFKPDGTKMYVVGLIGQDINEYNLSTAWDVSTAVFSQLFSISAQDLNPSGIFFKPDGTKMYLLGLSGRDVNEYNLSTAWDISTASFLRLFSVSAQESGPRGVFFKPDGTKMYVTGNSGQDVNEYNLSTAWNISTASFLQLFSVAAQEAEPYGVFFKPDGLNMYVVGISGDEVNEYNLSTPWDVSTATFSQFFSVAAQDTLPKGFFFKPDGTKMYVMGDTTDNIYQYSTATGTTITYDTSLQWSGGTAPTAPAIGDTDVLTFNTTDGGTTYKSALAIDGAV